MSAAKTRKNKNIRFAGLTISEILRIHQRNLNEFHAILDSLSDKEAMSLLEILIGTRENLQPLVEKNYEKELMEAARDVHYRLQLKLQLKTNLIKAANRPKAPILTVGEKGTPLGLTTTVIKARNARNIRNTRNTRRRQ